MAFFETGGIEPAGIACAVPDCFLPVSAFGERFGAEAVRRFSAGTGIRSVCRALPGQTAGDLAYAAAEELFSRLGNDRRRVGVMVFVTQSPDYRRPSTACVLQHRLKLPTDCACLELSLGCSGFLYGLQTLLSLMASSGEEDGLLLIGETASVLTAPTDKSTAMMFGDAGSAVLLRKTGRGSVRTLLRSDGSRYRSIILPAGGFRDMNPDREEFLCSDGNRRTLYDLFMDGPAVFSFTITDVPETIREYLEASSSAMEDYDAVVLHQANVFILKQLARRLNIPREKMPVSLDRYGNTGGVSIPLTLCDRYGADGGADVLRVLMSGFGVGLSWGAAAAEIRTDAVFPVVRTREIYAEGKLRPGEY